jgi:hypothetical protein
VLHDDTLILETPRERRNLPCDVARFHGRIVSRLIILRLVWDSDRVKALVHLDYVQIYNYGAITGTLNRDTYLKLKF